MISAVSAWPIRNFSALWPASSGDYPQVSSVTRRRPSSGMVDSVGLDQDLRTPMSLSATANSLDTPAFFDQMLTHGPSPMHPPLVPTMRSSGAVGALAGSISIVSCRSCSGDAAVSCHRGGGVVYKKHHDPIESCQCCHCASASPWSSEGV